MKKILLLLPFISAGLFAQNMNEPCATMPVYYAHSKNPTALEKYAMAESNARLWLKNPLNAAAAQKSGSLIKIPVVVHVVYKNAQQNVPDSLIYSQLNVMNECFRKANSNYNTTRSVFDSLGSDIDIEFCLANFDPDGNPTSGIIRKQAPSGSSFDPLFNMDKVKKPVFGGDSAWPCSKYLNIWLADMSIFGQTVVLGYATFPGSDPALDGVVIQHNYFGKYATPGFLGRTTVHEVGHWLGMRHIWADDDNGQNPQSVYCDSTDFVDDTPNAGPKSQSNCDKTKNTCTLDAVYWGGVNPPDMVENYMDYSSDDCMTLFTKGQRARMYSFLSTDPNRIAVTTSTAGCNIISSAKTSVPMDAFVNLFPVPANNEVNISVTASFENYFILTIFDNTGRVISEEKMETESKRINTLELPEGIYFVKLSGNGHTTLKKFVVIH